MSVTSEQCTLMLRLLRETGRRGVHSFDLRAEQHVGNPSERVRELKAEGFKISAQKEKRDKRWGVRYRLLSEADGRSMALHNREASHAIWFRDHVDHCKACGHDVVWVNTASQRVAVDYSEIVPVGHHLADGLVALHPASHKGTVTDDPDRVAGMVATGWTFHLPHARSCRAARDHLDRRDVA